MNEERTVQVGDFFEESWGYDQTNVTFYQVVRISETGKTVWLRRVQSAAVSDDGGPTTHVAPLADTWSEISAVRTRDGLLKRRLRRSPTYKEWSVNMTSYSNAYLWDCKPAYETGQGWGH